MLVAIRNLWRDSRARVIEEAAGKPRLDSISKEVGVLIFLLCVFSLILGDWICKAELSHVTVRDGLDVLIAAAVVLWCLAFYFRWPSGLTLFLQLGCGLLAIGLFAFWVNA